MNIIGLGNRELNIDENLEKNRNLELKKGDKFLYTKLNNVTVNGVYEYDEVLTCEVLGIRKGKDGRRVKVKDYTRNIQFTLLIDQSKAIIKLI